MFESLQAFIPVEWQGAFAFLSAPVAWIPEWHERMVNFAWYASSSGWRSCSRCFFSSSPSGRR